MEYACTLKGVALQAWDGWHQANTLAKEAESSSSFNGNIDSVFHHGRMTAYATILHTITGGNIGKENEVGIAEIRSIIELIR